MSSKFLKSILHAITSSLFNLANRDDFKKQKILDEARKAGKAPALLDEEGHVINPHIPEYIVKAPCTLYSSLNFILLLTLRFILF
jgi:hypothetical protein